MNGGVPEEQGEFEQGAEKCDAEKEQGEQKEDDGKITKTTNKQKSALEKIKLRELYKWLSWICCFLILR